MKYTTIATKQVHKIVTMEADSPKEFVLALREENPEFDCSETIELLEDNVIGKINKVRCNCEDCGGPIFIGDSFSPGGEDRITMCFSCKESYQK